MPYFDRPFALFDTCSTVINDEALTAPLCFTTARINSPAASSADFSPARSRGARCQGGFVSCDVAEEQVGGLVAAIKLSEDWWSGRAGRGEAQGIGRRR